MNRREWEGRAVTFGEFSIKEGRAVRAAFAEDGENGSYTCLAMSMRYADTGELVFASADDIWAQPFRLQQRIVVLAGEAARANGIIGADSADGANGVARDDGEGDEAIGPSH